MSQAAAPGALTPALSHGERGPDALTPALSHGERGPSDLPSPVCGRGVGGEGTSPLRANRFPISRWYLLPLADRLAAALVAGPARPNHLTLAGLSLGVLAAAVLVAWPAGAPLAAVLVLGAWFLDRTDGLLARRQGTASAAGAWLDANVDELVDLGLHVAVAAAAAGLSGSLWPWTLLVAFLLGKYLLVYGLWTTPDALTLALSQKERGREALTLALSQKERGREAWPRRLYHLPGNTDVRVHLLVVMLVVGWLTAELALVAFYYNVRWIVRFGLLVRRGAP